MSFYSRVLLLCALSAWSLGAAATIVSFDGAGSIATNPPSGLVGHGEVNENPIFNENGVQIPHPYAHLLSGVYTELSSVDAFDFATGDDLGHRGGTGFAASTPAGHGFSTLGVTSDDSNPVWLSISGLVMDTNVATDYYIDTNANVEHRIYRGGSFLFYEEVAVDTFTPVFGFNDVVLSIDIDWTATFANAADQITMEVLSASSWAGPGNDLPLVSIAMQASYASNPIQAAGSTTEGQFGVWEVSGNTWTFDTVTTGVPLPGSGVLMLGGLLFGLRRYRAAK